LSGRFWDDGFNESAFLLYKFLFGWCRRFVCTNVSSGCFLRFVLSLGLFSKFFGRSSGSGDVFSTWLWHLTYWLWQIL